MLLPCSSVFVQTQPNCSALFSFFAFRSCISFRLPGQVGWATRSAKRTAVALLQLFVCQYVLIIVVEDGNDIHGCHSSDGGNREFYDNDSND